MDSDRLIQVMGKAAAAVLLLCALLFVLYTGLYAALPSPELPEGDADVPVIESPQAPPSDAWQVFARQAAAGTPGQLSRIFRFAGYMFLGEKARAILDQLEQREQFIVAEGDRIGSVEVVSIHRDRVVLRAGGREEELWLSFQAGPAGGGPAVVAPPNRELRWDERVIETSPFGKRIAENRWILSRDALLGYHQAMLDDPERLAALFLSMKPDYTPEREIAGYRVGMEGEEDFFAAVGLQEGDVVREVNSLQMKSQARAEYLIREFAQGRLSAVVLDIERGGTPQKLIHYIR